MSHVDTPSFLAACPKGRVANHTRRPQRGPSGTPLKNAVQISARRRAYTLIEILIVAVIIVLMLGMALPVFRAITGSRSEAGASNIIASMLGRARTDAIGLDRFIGVAVIYNPNTQVTNLAEVWLPNTPAWTTTQSIAPQSIAPSGFFSATYLGTTYYFVNSYATAQTLATNLPAGVPTASAAGPWAAAVGGPPLEIRPNTELLPLPTGVGVQTICNAYFDSTGARKTDGYLNLGVILFDGSGRLVSQNYGISHYSKLASVAGLGGVDYPVANGTIESPYTSVAPFSYGVPSQYGLVVFQREAFVAQNFSTSDPAYNISNSNGYPPSLQITAYTDTSNGPSQQAEENWLDTNATPLLIDRYTGTLIRAE
jgi:Tfp pilus assembly protein FimT